MRLDSGLCRVSLVNERIPQVIPSHRLARHARTVQQQQQQQQQAGHSASLSWLSASALHDEQRSIEDSITAHRRHAMGDLGTGTRTRALPGNAVTAAAAEARAPAAACPAPSAAASASASLTSGVAQASANATVTIAPTSLPRPGEAAHGPSGHNLRSTSSDPPSSHCEADDRHDSLPHLSTGGSVRVPSPLSLYLSPPSSPTRFLGASSSPPSSFAPIRQTSKTGPPSSSPYPFPSSDAAGPPARLHRLYRRMKLDQQQQRLMEEEDDAPDSDELAAARPLEPSHVRSLSASPPPSSTAMDTAHSPIASASPPSALSPPVLPMYNASPAAQPGVQSLNASLPVPASVLVGYRSPLSDPLPVPPHSIVRMLARHPSSGSPYFVRLPLSEPHLLHALAYRSAMLPYAPYPPVAAWSLQASTVGRLSVAAHPLIASRLPHSLGQLTAPPSLMSA